MLLPEVQLKLLQPQLPKLLPKPPNKKSKKRKLLNLKKMSIWVVFSVMIDMNQE